MVAVKAMTIAKAKAKAEGKAPKWKRRPSTFLQRPIEQGETGKDRQEQHSDWEDAGVDQRQRKCPIRMHGRNTEL